MALAHEQERQRNRHGGRDDGVDHPAHPGERDGPVAPVRAAQKDPALDQRGESHGHRAQEQGVGRVCDHDGPDLGVQGVAQDGDEQGEGEEDGVEDEENHRQPVEPVRFEGDGDEEERNDPRAHGHGEPRR